MTLSKKAVAASNLIAQTRKRKGLSQAELAEKVGAHWITISKLERGVMQLTDSWRERIGQALEVDPWDLIPGARELPPIYLVGRLFEGGEIDDITDENLMTSVDTEFFVHPEYRWIEVGDNSLYPWYQAGDILCTLQLYEDEIGEHQGRVCVAFYDNAEGEPEHAVGVIEPGITPNTHTIQRFGKPPLRDVTLTDLWVFVVAIFEVGKSRPQPKYS